MKHYIATLALFLITLPLLAAPPTPPNSISARTTSAGYVEINWSRATDTDGQIVGYELIRNGSAISVGNVTQYLDSDIESGVRYTYRVVAVDNDGEKSVGNNVVTISSSGSSSSSSSSSSSNSMAVPQDNNVTQLGMCVDADDDGWGWDGEKSCLVSAVDGNDCATDQSCVNANILDNDNLDTNAQVLASSIVCIDGDGDGWGWTGTKSCRIEIENNGQIAICIDVDGDGWGWTGTETCIP